MYRLELIDIKENLAKKAKNFDASKISKQVRTPLKLLSLQYLDPLMREIYLQEIRLKSPYLYQFLIEVIRYLDNLDLNREIKKELFREVCNIIHNHIKAKLKEEFEDLKQKKYNSF